MAGARGCGYVVYRVWIRKLPGPPPGRRRRLPLVQLEGVVMGQQRMDINLTSLIATLREEARPPIGAIQLGD